MVARVVHALYDDCESMLILVTVFVDIRKFAEQKRISLLQASFDIWCSMLISIPQSQIPASHFH